MSDNGDVRRDDGEPSTAGDQAALDARVAASVADVRDRIVRAGGRDVRLVGVTKTFGPDAVIAAARAGCDGVGENYAQETVAKWAALHDLLGVDGVAALPPLHFIGQLQSNKVRTLASLVSVYETIDRRSLLAELAKRCPGARILVQVDATGEAGKGGCPTTDVPSLVVEAIERGLHVEGLMTVGPTYGGPEAAQRGFRAVRALADRLGLETCSMGMSDDLEVAVACGATEVRVGSALFGPRPPQRGTGGLA